MAFPSNLFTTLGHINLHHCKAGNKDFYLYVLRKTNVEQRQLLMGLQEPYCHDRRIVDIPSRNLLYDRNCKETPRAAMYFSSDVDFLPLEMFIERDLVAGIWKTSDPEFPEIVVASVYMDGSFKTAIRPKKFINLLKYCRKNNLQAVLLSDSNAHNELWFEDTTDDRGQLLEDIAYKFNLAIMNVGPLEVNYTYYRDNSQSIIDITYCSSELSRRIHDWHVTWEVVNSDHRLIEFKIDIHNDTELKYRSLKKGNWTRFSSLFDEFEPEENNIWTKGILEYQSCKLFEDIEKILDITHPFKKVTCQSQRMGGTTVKLKRNKDKCAEHLTIGGTSETTTLKICSRYNAVSTMI